jgi:hypothetical protein
MSFFNDSVSVIQGYGANSGTRCIDTPPEVTERANAAIATIIPGKSKIQNERAYIQFREWCTTKNVVRISEKMLLAYLDEKSAKLKPPTLWSTFSMLKAMLNVKENIDVRKVPTNVPYLKNKSVGYRGKKSKILTQEDITLTGKKKTEH